MFGSFGTQAAGSRQPSEAAAIGAGVCDGAGALAGVVVVVVLRCLKAMIASPCL